MVSTGLGLVAANLPGQDLVYGNRIYVSPADFAQLSTGPPGAKQCLAEAKNVVFTMEPHPRMEPGTIGMNKVQREFAKVGLQAEVFTKGFSAPAKFELGVLRLEVDSMVKTEGPRKEIDGEVLEPLFLERYKGQCFMPGQPVVFDFEGTLLKFTVVSVGGFNLGDGAPVPPMSKGTMIDQTELEFSAGPSGRLAVLSRKATQRSIFRPDFDFEELGIGGLGKEFGDIFRRAFASRVFPPHIMRDLGINHVRGMLLYGPPGTGKTLMARQIAKFLKAREPKIVNGPEVLNKYVGASEENIRKLFADAEAEYKKEGEASQLHIVIFDEIDAICKSRGTRSDSTGVSDSIVNQLLSKIDGVDSLNNILLIGMTNRLDLIDEALIRPGRLEVHVEISLPDEKGRIEILNIHTKSMRDKNYLASEVSLPALATRTKNMSGAEIEGLVRSATSFALNRKVNVKNLSQQADLSNLQVGNEDFDYALGEVKPAFGQHTDDFDDRVRYGIVEYSAEFKRTLGTLRDLVEQVRSSENTRTLSVLLEGPRGSGKTALASFLATQSDFPFVRMICPENYVGYGESAKVNHISKIFDDAYKSSASIVVLDNIERLMDYVRIGPRFSNMVLQAIAAAIRREPPHSRKIMVIGTTSCKDFLDDADLTAQFHVRMHIPALSRPEHYKEVLRSLDGWDPASLDKAVGSINAPLGVQEVLLVAEMAKQRTSGAGQQAGRGEAFEQALRDCGLGF